MDTTTTAADKEVSAAIHQEAVFNSTMQKVADAQAQDMERVKREGTGTTTAADKEDSAAIHQEAVFNNTMQKVVDAQMLGKNSRTKRSGPGKGTGLLAGAAAGGVAGGPVGAIAGGALGYMAGHKLQGMKKQKEASATRTV